MTERSTCEREKVWNTNEASIQLRYTRKSALVDETGYFERNSKRFGRIRSAASSMKERGATMESIVEVPVHRTVRRLEPMVYVKR